ncbi:MAG: tyrosine-type recombinase/integrase, partial [Hyphomonadaceae bacterium]|nr:tyrosine-type recombinase/integrase [Clostridia bacterium]
HSCASMLIAEGFDIKKIQEWLGHSSISTTGNIYGHIQHSSKVEMGNVLETTLEV